jgi:hypothetical protein
MNLRKALVSLVTVVAGTAVWAGCSSAGGDNQNGDDQDATGACKVIDEQTGKALTADQLKNLGDPIAQRILLGGCPQKVDGMLTAIRAAKDCTSPNITTRVVSERSLLLGKADSFRGVLTQDCQGGTDHDLFISIFGIDPSDDKLPQDGTEVIGHDKTNGVFNFYVNEGGWKFMGSSKDAVSSGYDCDANGACEPKSAKKARCWACHESGGINMKELQNPWHAWSNTPIHEEDVFKKFGTQLGQEQDGVNMETRTSGANGDWDQTRVKILKDKGAAELLRPLFCTLTFQLQATGSANSVSNVPAEFFFPAPPGETLVSYNSIGFSAGGVSIDAGEYAKALIKIDQKIVDGQGQQLQGADNKPIVDSPSGFIFPKKGDVDMRYIALLVDQKIVDRDFVLDVLHVDFTRPIFSPDRCALADDAPNLTGDKLTPDAIRDGFKTNLAKDDSDAAKQLLKNLGDTSDEAAHNTDVQNYIAACNARPKPDMVADILQYNAHLKAAAKAHRTSTPDGRQGIIEFAETLPVDNQKDSKASFDPKDCTLK